RTLAFCGPITRVRTSRISLVSGGAGRFWALRREISGLRGGGAAGASADGAEGPGSALAVEGTGGGSPEDAAGDTRASVTVVVATSRGAPSPARSASAAAVSALSINLLPTQSAAPARPAASNAPLPRRTIRRRLRARRASPATS